MKTFKDLMVWQKSMDLVRLVYTATKSFPIEEKFSLTSQIQRSAISIPSNIAEGKLRRTNKNFIQFLYISLGSCAELETQIIIAKDVGYIKTTDFEKIQIDINEIMKMITGLIKKLLEPKA
ncbi:MAG: four helix bundle protein [Candidatus Paceibacterota bacterium]